MKSIRLLLLLVFIGILVVACSTPAEAPTAAPEPTEAMEEPTEEMVEEPTVEPTEVMEEPTAEPTAVEEPTTAPEPTEAPTEEPTPEVMDPLAPKEACNEDLTGETIVIYQQAGREGPIAAILGQGFAYATEDAVRTINEAGGVCGATLEVAFTETQYDVEQEVAAYEAERVADPKPIVLLTYGSGATVALKDRVIEDQIVNLAAGVIADAIYNPRNGYTVGAVPIYSDQFAGFLQWLSDNWADVKPEGAGDEIVVGVIGWANAFGAGATTPEALAYAESLGITVLPLEEQAVSPDADVTGQLQNMLVNGANVIYNQSLSFSPVQVIGTLHAMGVWDSVVVGGVNWTMNIDVLTYLGENAPLAEGYYAVFPYYTWTDEDNPGVQAAAAAFEAGGYPETERSITYLLTFASFYAIRDALIHAINTDGYENLSGATYLAAMEDIGLVDALGIFQIDMQDGNRAPNMAQIRQWQLVDGEIVPVVVEDFFMLPDTRPAESE